MNTLKYILKTSLIILFLISSNAYGAEPKSIEKENQDTGIKKTEHLYTMEFRDADLKDVLRALGQENNLNIIISEKISGKVTLSFNKIKLMDAIDTILRISNLTYNREGNIMMVVSSPFGEGE